MWSSKSNAHFSYTYFHDTLRSLLEATQLFNYGERTCNVRSPGMIKVLGKNSNTSYDLGRTVPYLKGVVYTKMKLSSCLLMINTS
jgi:hypothetical protein